MAQVLEWTGQAHSVSSQGHDMVFMGVRRGLTEEGTLREAIPRRTPSSLHTVNRYPGHLSHSRY